MRYVCGHKDLTHTRLVQTASREFRGKGVNGVSIGDLMADLKLTHGGFYRHFESKEQLLAEAVVSAFEERARIMMQAASQAKPGFELQTIIEKYLSPEHCSNPAVGCPVAALAGEVARYPRFVRLRFETAVRAYGSRLVRFAPGTT